MLIKTPSDRPEFAFVDETWERSIRPFLAANEARRVAAVRLASASPVAATMAGVGVLASQPFGEFTLLAGAVVFALGIAFAASALERVRRRIGGGLLGLVAEALGVAYRQDAIAPACIADLQRLKLIGTYNRERWEDEVRGERNGSRFELIEANLRRVTGSGRNRRTVTVFHGAIVEIDYPHEFAGETVLQRDRGPFNALSRPGGDFSGVGLASPEFERAFEAWSTDQVEARTLLDPVVLERFQALEALFEGRNLRAAFLGGRLTIAVETGDRLNMGSMFQRLDRPDRVEAILKEFDLIFDLIDILVRRLDGRMDGPISVAALRTAAPKEYQA